MGVLCTKSYIRYGRFANSYGSRFHYLLCCDTVSLGVQLDVQKAPRFFETSGSTHPTPQLHMPGGLNHQKLYLIHAKRTWLRNVTLIFLRSVFIDISVLLGTLLQFLVMYLRHYIQKSLHPVLTIQNIIWEVFVQKIRIYGYSIAYSFMYCCILAIILWGCISVFYSSLKCGLCCFSQHTNMICNDTSMGIM